MPKRTNRFQKLVKQINEALVGQDAEVEESAMEPVLGDDDFREIDVLIRNELGPYRVKIAVEAKNESRPLAVGKIDSIVGKYRGPRRVEVNDVYVVSSRGFTSGAEKAAAAAGIKLLTLSEAETYDWGKLSLKNLMDNGQWTIPIEEFHIEPEPGVEITEGVLDEARIRCSCDECKNAESEDKGTLRQVAQRLFMRKFYSDRNLQEEFMEMYEPEKDGLFFTLNQGWQSAVLNYEGDEFPVQKVRIKIGRLTPHEIPPSPFSGARFRFRKRMRITRVQIKPDIQNDNFDLEKAHLVCTCKKGQKDLGSIADYIVEVINEHIPEKNPEIIRRTFEEMRETDGPVVVQVHVPLNHHYVEFEGERYPITELVIFVQGEESEGSLRFESFQMRGDQLSLPNVVVGEAKAGGKRFRIVMPQSLESPRISVDMTELENGEETDASGQ
ncbi:MAG: restriction endonuclease [Candidatus Brocadiia bacterium]